MLARVLVVVAGVAERLAVAREPEQDHSDVVLPAILVRGVDEPPCGFVERSIRLEDRPDVVLADHRRQAVGADEVDVAVAARVGECLDVHLRLRAEGAGDDRALRMVLGLLGAKAALAHQLLDQ